MRLFIECSGEHPTLARAEARAVVETFDPAAALAEEDGDVLVFTSRADPVAVGARLALARSVGEQIASGSERDLLSAAKEIDLKEQRFRVRAQAPRGQVRDLEARFGGAFRGGIVDLEQPEVEVRVVQGERMHLAWVRAAVDRSAFERRKTDRRPFTSPISMHPRYARVLVNLARVPPGGTLLDPFCGTGGILLEAALMGLRAVGGDIRRDMVEGTAANLRNEGVSADLATGDVEDIARRFAPADGIATDPPYGRSTTTKGEDTHSLYRRALEAFRDAVRPRGRAVVVFPDEPAVTEAARLLTLSEHYRQRIHKSLTRHVAVFQVP